MNGYAIHAVVEVVGVLLHARSGQRPSQPGVSMPDPQQALQARHAYLLQLVRELQSLPQNSQLMRLHQLQMALRITEQEKVAVLTAVRRQEFMFADEMRRRQAIARAGRGEVPRPYNLSERKLTIRSPKAWTIRALVNVSFPKSLDCATDDSQVVGLRDETK